jgi:hypothetical protein
MSGCGVGNLFFVPLTRYGSGTLTAPVQRHSTTRYRVFLLPWYRALLVFPDFRTTNITNIFSAVTFSIFVLHPKSDSEFI